MFLVYIGGSSKSFGRVCQWDDHANSKQTSKWTEADSKQKQHEKEANTLVLTLLVVPFVLFTIHESKSCRSYTSDCANFLFMTSCELELVDKLINKPCLIHRGNWLCIGDSMHIRGKDYLGISDKSICTVNLENN